MAFRNLSSRHSEFLLELACKKVTDINDMSLETYPLWLEKSNDYVKQLQATQDEEDSDGITRRAEYFERSNS